MLRAPRSRPASLDPTSPPCPFRNTTHSSASPRTQPPSRSATPTKKHPSRPIRTACPRVHPRRRNAQRRKSFRRSPTHTMFSRIRHGGENTTRSTARVRERAHRPLVVAAAVAVVVAGSPAGSPRQTTTRNTTSRRSTMPRATFSARLRACLARRRPRGESRRGRMKRMIPCMAQDRMRMACLGMCLRTCTSSPRGIPLSLLRTRADPTDGRTDGRPHRLAPEVNNVWPFWSYVGGAAGGALGYIVGNIPGAAAGALAGNRLGAVRDAKGKSVAQVFAGLGASQKAEILRALAFKVLGSMS